MLKLDCESIFIPFPTSNIHWVVNCDYSVRRNCKPVFQWYYMASVGKWAMKMTWNLDYGICFCTMTLHLHTVLFTCACVNCCCSTPSLHIRYSIMSPVSSQNLQWHYFLEEGDLMVTLWFKQNSWVHIQVSDTPQIALNCGTITGLTIWSSKKSIFYGTTETSFTPLIADVVISADILCINFNVFNKPSVFLYMLY